MNEQQIQDIADKVVAALNGLAPGDPSLWAIVISFVPLMAVAAAFTAAWVGWKNLKHQQEALHASNVNHETNLKQKQEADGRAEWWKRTQWALEATTSDDRTLYAYGAGILKLLAKSDLVGENDKTLLDTVWKESPTELQEDEINLVVTTAREKEDLTAEELAVLQSYIDMDGPPMAGDNESTYGKEGDHA